MKKDKYKETDVNRELIKFAEPRKSILGVYKGNNPEEENCLTYYFLTGNYQTLGTRLEEEITELDINLSNKVKKGFDILSWPDFPNNKNKDGFIGEPIWIRF